MLITPGAVDGLSALDSGYSTLYLETVSMSKVDESDLVERARNVIGVSGLAEVRSSEDTMQLARDAQRFESVKAAVYAGAVIVLLVAALSLPVLRAAVSVKNLRTE